MNNSIKVALVGAFDRNNFGDVLMPIVVEKQIIKECSNLNVVFNYYSSTDSNMDRIKGKNSKNMSYLYSDYNDIVIVVGGEVLKSDYLMMYITSQKSRIKVFLLRCFHKLLKNTSEKFAKKKLKGKTLRPWILDKNLLNCSKLIYNTVGGNPDNNSCIANFDYISIRNSIDYKIIKKINDRAKLVPDSMLLTSQIITDKELITNSSDYILQICQKKYIVIQMSNAVGHSIVNEIVKQIDLIRSKYDYDIVLLPIGLARGHDDQIVLSRIKKNCKSTVTLLPEINIYETLNVLKNAKAFIGSSLHGIVLSESYDVPYILLTNKLSKLNNYIEDWGYDQSKKFINADELCDFINYLHDNYNNLLKDLKENKEKQFNIVKENFNEIISQINSIENT